MAAPATPVAADPAVGQAVVAAASESLLHKLIPAKDSAAFKGIVTTVQAFVGYVLVILADPQVQGVAGKYWPALAAGIPIVSGVLAYVVGLLRSDVANY